MVTFKDNSALNVYSEIQTNDVPKPRNTLWSLNNDLGDKWYIARVPVDYSANFRIIFESVLGASINGSLAIDDIYISPKGCPNPVNCDFESEAYPYCSWLNSEVTNETVEWDLYSASESDQFGPIVDNTIDDESGHFILTSGSIKDLPSQLVSELLEPTDESDVCFSFYYYFPADSEYKLTIKLAEYNKTEVRLWSLTDKQSDKNAWFYGQLRITANDVFRIYIEGVVGNNENHFVGVDDITLRYSTDACNFIPEAALIETTTTTRATTTTRPPLADFDCDFEEQCSWYNLGTNRFNWTITRAENVEPSSLGPTIDHTSGSPQGSYLLAPSNLSTYTTTSFISQYFNGTKCLEFWYYAYGTNVI